LTLHERVGGDLSGPPGWLITAPRLREREEPLHEGDGELVLAVSCLVETAVHLARSGVLDRDVRRVPHHCVVLPHPQRLVELLPVLGRLRYEVLVSPCGTAEQGLLSRAPWKQGISRVHPRLELRRLLQAGLLAHCQGGEQQSESSDRDGEGRGVP